MDNKPSRAASFTLFLAALFPIFLQIPTRSGKLSIGPPLQPLLEIRIVLGETHIRSPVGAAYPGRFARSLQTTLVFNTAIATPPALHHPPEPTLEFTNKSNIRCIPAWDSQPYFQDLARATRSLNCHDHEREERVCHRIAAAKHPTQHRISIPPTNHHVRAPELSAETKMIRFIDRLSRYQPSCTHFPQTETHFDKHRFSHSR